LIEVTLLYATAKIEAEEQANQASLFKEVSRLFTIGNHNSTPHHAHVKQNLKNLHPRPRNPTTPKP